MTKSAKTSVKNKKKPWKLQVKIHFWESRLSERRPKKAWDKKKNCAGDQDLHFSWYSFNHSSSSLVSSSGRISFDCMGVRVKVSKVRNSPGPEVLKCNHTKKVEVIFYHKQRLRLFWVLRDLRMRVLPLKSWQLTTCFRARFPPPQLGLGFLFWFRTHRPGKSLARR